MDDLRYGPAETSAIDCLNKALTSWSWSGLWAFEL